MPDPHLCVWCNLARAVVISPGEVEWIVTLETPRDHEHETIEGLA